MGCKIFSKIYDISENKFISEDNEGNIEYKWRLDKKNELGIKKILTQMLWRLNEGYEKYGTYEAYYLIGVYDNGNLGNLTEEEIDENINIFKYVLENGNIKLLCEKKEYINGSYIYLAHIRN